MRKGRFWGWLVAALLWPSLAAAQITPTYTFTAGTVINPDEVNANFALLANALNRTGGTMTGTLTTVGIVPSTTETYDLGSSTVKYRDGWFSRNVAIGGTTTLATVSITSSATLANTGLHVLDTDASHDLILKPGSNLTADRTLTLTTGDANRTLTLAADVLLNQSVATTSAPSFTRLTVTGSSGNGDGTAALQLTGSYGTVGSAFGYGAPSFTISPAAGSIAAIYSTTGSSIQEAASGTHAVLAGIYAAPPTIVSGDATVTDTATVYITGPAAASVSGGNYALYVNSGTTRVSNLSVASTTAFGNVVAYGASAAIDFSVSNTAITCDSATENSISDTAATSILRLTTAGSGNCIIKGMTAPSAGSGMRLLTIINATGQVVIFNDEDTSETTAANRISTAGTSVIYTAESTITAIYDRTSSRWRVGGTSSNGT